MTESVTETKTIKLATMFNKSLAGGLKHGKQLQDTQTPRSQIRNWIIQIINLPSYIRRHVSRANQPRWARRWMACQ
jgi:hypothetical protein